MRAGRQLRETANERELQASRSLDISRPPAKEVQDFTRRKLAEHSLRAVNRTEQTAQITVPGRPYIQLNKFGKPDFDYELIIKTIEEGRLRRGLPTVASRENVN